MEKLQRSQAYLRKRKMMLVLPLLVLPFITLGFWALGGGKAAGTTAEITSIGLNLNLPDANLKDDDRADKLSFYDRAEKDSIKRDGYRRSDPYQTAFVDTLSQSNYELENMASQSAAKHNQQLNPSPLPASNNNTEQQLMQKLAQLQRQMAQPEASPAVQETKVKQSADEDDFAGQIDRLEGIMQGMDASDGEDSEMKQISNTLEKILDIQHPERVKERMKKKSAEKKETAFAVRTTGYSNVVGLIDTPRIQTRKSNGFFGLEEYGAAETADNAVEAFVNSNQILVDGSIIQLRLATDVFINGKLVSKGTLVSGITRLNGERLEADIQTIRTGNSLLPVKLALYDLDGLPGIHVPGSISRDVAKQSADNSIQMLEVASLDPSLKAQAAAAGLGAAKNLLSRKVKQVKVTVKAGYKVLLRSKED